MGQNKGGADELRQQGLSVAQRSLSCAALCNMTVICVLQELASDPPPLGGGRLDRGGGARGGGT